MSESKATLIVTAVPDPLAMLDILAFINTMDPLFEQYGGQLRYRGKINSAIEGTANFRVILVMTFESEEKIEALINSPEYIASAPRREKAFKSMDMVISTEIGAM